MDRWHENVSADWLWLDGTLEPHALIDMLARHVGHLIRKRSAIPTCSAARNGKDER